MDNINDFVCGFTPDTPEDVKAIWWKEFHEQAKITSMKAQLKEVKVWAPHKEIKDPAEEEFQIPGAMRVYVGSLYVGWIVPVSVEPEELYKLEAFRILTEMDWNDTLLDSRLLSNKPKQKKGKPLQEILDNIELVFKDFLNKVIK